MTVPLSQASTISSSIFSSSTSVSYPTPLSPTSPEYKAISSYNFIYDAGVDKESRPILVLCACRLPDSAFIDYDLILAYLLARFNDVVENDYVLVFFSAPAQYRPGWFWLLKAYRALDRRYKKNLKALYVVHLTGFYRFVFDLANKITSPKFARKLHYISELSHLDLIIPLTQLHVPKEVADYNLSLPPPSPLDRTTYPYSLSMIPKPPGKVFGRSFEDLELVETELSGKAVHIPEILVSLGTILFKEGSLTEGVFRKSPSSEQLRIIKEQLDQGVKVDLSVLDIHIPAVLLKILFRELPSSPIPLSSIDSIGSLDGLSKPDRLQRIRNLLPLSITSDITRHSIHYLFKLLHEISLCSEKNFMTAHNISVVFTPNLVHADLAQGPADTLAGAGEYLERIRIAGGVVSGCVEWVEGIFGEAKLVQEKAAEIAAIVG